MVFSLLNDSLHPIEHHFYRGIATNYLQHVREFHSQRFVADAKFPAQNGSPAGTTHQQEIRCVQRQFHQTGLHRIIDQKTEQIAQLRRFGFGGRFIRQGGEILIGWRERPRQNRLHFWTAARNPQFSRQRAGKCRDISLREGIHAVFHRILQRQKYLRFLRHQHRLHRDVRFIDQLEVVDSRGFVHGEEQIDVAEVSYAQLRERNGRRLRT